jgi:SAM-dependent methyltransferase
MKRIAHVLRTLPFTPSTVIDYGCGYGALIPYLENQSVAYLGIDNDPASIESAKARLNNRPDSDIVQVKNPLDLSPGTESRDSVLILNGVCHHLEESTLKDVIERIKSRAIIILDHDGTKEKLSKIQLLMQRMDKGKFVRPKTFFDTIYGYKCMKSEVFYIPSQKIPLWRYFMNIYIKEHT